MKNILIPTDFSESAKNAFKFAQAFLPKSANLKVLHTYRPEIDARYAYLGKPSEGFYKKRVKQLSDFIEDFNDSTSGGVATLSKVRKEVTIGFPTDTIVEASKEVDLIIMGGTGTTNSIDRAIGSVASHVAQKAHCPVLIIPKNAVFTGFRDMLFASHHQSLKAKLLQKAVEFAKPFNSKLHFIHVQEKAENTEVNMDVEDNLFHFLFQKEAPDFDFNLATINANSAAEGLNQYIIENKIDLAFLVTHHRNFWERLFHSSVTKEMAIHTSIPMLVLHHD